MTEGLESAAVVIAQESPVVRLIDVSLRYGQTIALNGVTLDIPSAKMVGFIGPDGVGKSSLLSLVSGARRIQRGKIQTLGHDMADANNRDKICPLIAYMPQGLGKNLYPTLSVFENADFFGQLFGQGKTERRDRIAHLLESTGLASFADRPAGKLSGGMKQKLGLCCALIHDPELLILDEPTTGVDPLSRRQFWELIDRIRHERNGMSVLVATAYMEEAERFDWLIAMDDGTIRATGTPSYFLERTGADSLEDAFISMLPDEKRRGHRKVQIPPRDADSGKVAIEAKHLTRRFRDFVAVDNVSFRIEQGEIFGFLGSNGCGKTTTMKMLTGLLPCSEGKAWLLGREVEAQDLETRKRVGYMSQNFSLYSELTVHQNLLLHARLFQVPKEQIPARIDEMLDRFGLRSSVDALPESLPLGLRQRLSLAVSLIHKPELLILDEPTSGVDPVARDAFWEFLVELSRKDKVTIFISTHFINEAQRCDRISLMNAGKVLVSDTPEAITSKKGASKLEDAFIQYLEEAVQNEQANSPQQIETSRGLAPETNSLTMEHSRGPNNHPMSLMRMLSISRREGLTLSRDPISLTLAVLGSVILMFIMGYGISMDVENLSFAVLDRDQTTSSRDYTLNLYGSRYFQERPPISDYDELDRRMKSGELTLAIEIPPNFGRDLDRGSPVQVGVWIDGAMPQRAETVRGYMQGIHASWLSDKAAHELGQRDSNALANIETRFRYNPDIKSIVSMVPAVIPLLLLLIPAILTALSIVREKDLGSIVNFYVTPTTRLELLLGKQFPYIALGMINFLTMVALAVTAFGVPLKGSFLVLATGALLYVTCSTAMGLLISTFTKSQVAAIFGTAVLTILPAVQFCGMLDPVSSLEGAGAFFGRIYPTTHFLTLSRGAFSKGLGDRKSVV